ncbi:MAG: hypothetical protein R3B96_14200 [Pirellulaceae bacterium]
MSRLDRAINSQEHLGTALRPVPDRIIRDQANAAKLVQLVNGWDLETALTVSREPVNWRFRSGLMTNALVIRSSPNSARTHQAQYLRFADEMIDDPQPENNRDLVFLLQWLAAGNTESGADRVIRAAKAGIGTDEPLWPIVFDPYSTDSPQARRVLDALADPIPPGMIGLGILECANGLSLGGVEFHHPFDSDAGAELLAGWLGRKDDASSSEAQSATAALPFIKHARRNELLQLAVDHPHPLVKAEAGWALVMLEDQRGIRLLQAVCRDVRFGVYRTDLS